MNSFVTKGKMSEVTRYIQKLREERIKMNDLFLTDEDIWGKEPTDSERSLMDENNRLKMKLINSDDLLDNACYTIEQIKAIVKTAIETNIRKTNYEHSVPVIKSYREALLVLREIEKELDEYYDRVK